MRCYYCDKKLKGNEKTCPYCGHSLFDESSGSLSGENWQPVSSSNSRSLTRMITTKTLMIAALAAACIAVIVIFFISGKNSGDKNDDELVTIPATTVSASATQPSSENKSSTAPTASPASTSSTESDKTEAPKKSYKELLEFVDSLGLMVDGSLPEPHIKDDALVLEYYYLGVYTPEGEENPTQDNEEHPENLFFDGYKQRLVSITQYLDKQIRDYGYTISRLVVEGYDANGTQFFHMQKTYKS